jgi:hypothetical protein
MFDDIPDPATCGELTPDEMVSAIRACHRTEAASAGRKWAFTAMLLRAREDEAAAEEQTWAHDTWAAVKDEIAAAMSLSPRRASGQIRIAEALTQRLPKVAELLAHGIISAKVAATIVYRTEYVAAEAQTVVDAEIAARAQGLGTLSDTELDLSIDAWSRNATPMREPRTTSRGGPPGPVPTPPRRQPPNPTPPPSLLNPASLPRPLTHRRPRAHHRHHRRQAATNSPMSGTPRSTPRVATAPETVCAARRHHRRPDHPHPAAG